MPHPNDLGLHFSVERVKTLLMSLTPIRLADSSFLESVERQLEEFFHLPAFWAALMEGEPNVWQAAASVRKGHHLIFHCFCSWGMPLEKAIALLMTMKPTMAVPRPWSKNYIDVFSDICAYGWKAAPLAALLVKLGEKEKVPAVSLKLLFRSAYRKKQLDDILLAMRLHMPEMNVRVELALGWLLDEFSEQRIRLNKLPMELFTPHTLRASYLEAHASRDIRQVLWGTPLTYKSRVTLGRMQVAWQRCPLAVSLRWESPSDVLSSLGRNYEMLGADGFKARMAEESDFNAIVRACFIQEQVDRDTAENLLSTDAVNALIELEYIAPLLPDQKWKHLSSVPESNPAQSNIGINVDTVV